MAEETEGDIILLLVTSGSSFLLTFLVIVYYLARRRLFSTFSFELVLMLCVSDFLFSSVNFFRSVWMLVDRDAKINDTGCYLIGIHIQTFMLSSFLCTSTIQYSIYQKVINQEKIHQKSAFKRFWIINYMVPLLSALALYISGSIGHIGPFEGTFCFINTGNQLRTDIMMVVFYYVPYTAILLYNSIIIGCVINYYRKLKQTETNLYLNEYLKLIAYPIILLSCFLPIIMARILSNFQIENETFLKVAYCIDNLIGFFNAVIYFLVSMNPCQVEKFERVQSITLKKLQEQLIYDQIIEKQDMHSILEDEEDQNYIQSNLLSPQTNIYQKSFYSNQISSQTQTDEQSL